ncbi:MAG: sigma 54-interacting transcriptional regulator [Pseudomonadota bacterium]
MTDITFDSAFEAQSNAELSGLFAALEVRGLKIAHDGQAPCHSLVVPAATDAAREVSRARELGAKRILALTTGAGQWAYAEELGGRLTRIHMPENDSAAILALEDVLAAPFSPIVAVDASSRTLVSLARRVARHEVSVFINGPTGSGKEVLSRLIHSASHRAGGPFVALNCAAIPENMLEAMLFGHEKGAFTGAASANKGYLRAAEGGTLLLDEISEMPLPLQAKLLRVLQEKVVTPVGAQKEVAVDIRILATSNRDMAAEIADGRFREDLFFRLNVFPLETLALAGRRDDIPALAQSFITRHGQGPAPLLTPAALEALKAHHWPGNVRELENVIQRALVLADGSRLAKDHIMLTAQAAGQALARAA